jgi:hypothetical protein
MDTRWRQIADHLLSKTWAGEFDPASISAKLLPDIFVLDVQRDSTGKTSHLRIRLVGTAIDQIFNRPLEGHAMEEYIHGPRGDDVLKALHHCADTREPVWMRQVVHIRDRVPRFVEGGAIYLQPERIYGGLVVGEVVGLSVAEGFERSKLTPPERRAGSAS